MNVAVVARRLAGMLVVLWLLASVMFLLVRLAPGDPTAHLALDASVPASARQIQVERFGLDHTLPVQYSRYLSGLLAGDLGWSTSRYPATVRDVIATRLPRSVALLVTGTLLAYAVGFSLGKRAGWRPGSWTDRVVTTLAVATHTAFTPWIALLALWIFAFGLGWLPSGRMVSPAVWSDVSVSADAVLRTMLATAAAAAVAGVAVAATLRRFGSRALRPARVASAVAVVGLVVWWSVHPLRVYAFDIARHALLPTVTIVIVGFGATALLTRTAMLATRQADYVTYARARGLPESFIRDRHAAPAAQAPVIASLLLNLAAIVTGSIVFEAVFSWPGLGMAFIESVQLRDVPLATGIVLIYGVLLMGAHLVYDLLAPWFDPRHAP